MFLTRDEDEDEEDWFSKQEDYFYDDDSDDEFDLVSFYQENELIFKDLYYISSDLRVKITGDRAAI